MSMWATLMVSMWKRTCRAVGGGDEALVVAVVLRLSRAADSR
jgi:hypothetical protein